MTRGAGEMSFLDHLEELRRRLLWSAAAVVVGVGVGIWAVDRWQLVVKLTAPIAPYVPNGKLVATGPTEPVLVVLKLGLAVGLVLASPVILWQVWAFVAPGLYAREKKALVPALFAGLLLFLTGAVLAYLFLLPTTLRVLLGIQSEAFVNLFTADRYFGFVLQLVLALGLSFELPLVLILLAWLGVLEAAQLRGFRRYAIVLAFLGGAILSPGTDILSMLFMTAPLLVLYEIGVLGAAIIGRRRAQAALTAAVLAVLGLTAMPSNATAQVPEQVRQDSLRADSAHADSARHDGAQHDAARPGQVLDSATAHRMGLPTAPSRNFAAPDSVMRALLDRPNYQATRFRADSAKLYVSERHMVLTGDALTERQGSQLEADSIRYDQASCLLNAAGDPKLFDHGQVLVGRRIRYNSCQQRGMVDNALTNFNNAGTVWFLRGNVAQDSSARRIYAASSDITSCDLPSAHYHFSAREVKWIARDVMVARPVVLYIADVPILWLPFIFQDMRSGRRSGILVPRFGLNDIVRPTRSHRRQVTNVGYYWAPSDYFDVTAKLDWYASRYVRYGLAGEYRWLDRFVGGGFDWNDQREIGGRSSTNVQWNHHQQFNLNTSLSLDLNYIGSTDVLNRNAINPLVNTQQITSQLRFTKRFGWGNLDFGGNRSQTLTNRSVQQTLPTLSISPVPIEIGSNVTWSPTVNFSNSTTTNTPFSPLLRVLPGGVLDTVPQFSSSRTTTFDLGTPFRIGSFNWQNSVRMIDNLFEERDAVRFRTPDLSTADPNDSLTVSRAFTSRFQTGIDWNTSIGLPILFRGSWKLQPSVGVANATGLAPFAVRNRNTNGDFVVQGKRFNFGLNAAPTVFAFFPGIGPITRIRHTFAPTISYSYSPAARLSETFARAIAAPGRPIELRSLPTQAISVGLSQTFEGKMRPPPGDTLGASARKLRLLSITTSPLSYDFEKAKLQDSSGWVTSSITNSLLSELLPGFSLSLTHDLWRGSPGSDTSHFDPFLQSVSANFSMSSRTLCTLGSILGLCHRPTTGNERPTPLTSYVANYRPGAFSNVGQLPMGQSRAFSANFNYTLSRARPQPTPVPPATIPLTPSTRQNLGFSLAFSPTPFWGLSWRSQYDITQSKFADQVVDLSRDLHDWRATFSFVRNPNGNVALYFSVALTDLPELKFDYTQTTVER